MGRRQKQKLLGLIRKHDDPILHTPCTLADEAGRADRIETMKAILAATDNGVGIAAPQCGFNDRVVVVHHSYEPWPCMPYAMIDPAYHTLGVGSKLSGIEGCLSYPKVTCDVDRFDWIRVVWVDEDGSMKDSSFRGFPARVIQHEIDHLDGICRVGDEWRRQQEEGAE